MNDDTTPNRPAGNSPDIDELRRLYEASRFAPRPERSVTHGWHNAYPDTTFNAPPLQLVVVSISLEEIPKLCA